MSKKKYLKALALLRVNNDRNKGPNYIRILLHQAKGIYIFSLILLCIYM